MGLAAEPRETDNNLLKNRHSFNLLIITIMNLQDLHNPNKIDGILLWNNGKPIEVSKDSDQGFQEYPKSVELWQDLKDGRITRVKRWLKKSITHLVINNQFVAK